MTKVSIIVPVYNVYQYLDKCLSSLKDQTLNDIEFIIVNDGTKDDSQTIIDKYVKSDNRFKSYIKANGGLGDARNYGINYATGEYIGFLDADDYIDSTMYEKMYDLAIKKDSDLVECDFYWCYSKKNIIDTANYYNSDNIKANIRVLVCNKLFKRDIIIKNNISFPLRVRYEDISFTYKFLAYSSNFAYLNEALYFYVQRNDSLSNDQNEKVRDIFLVLDELENYYKNNYLYEKYSDIFEYISIKYLLGSSFLRILGIKNKILRKSILKENWNYLNKKHPNWKKNMYLNSINTLKNKYYLNINEFTYYLFSKLFLLKWK